MMIKEKSSKTRQRIIEAAFKLFYSQGYYSTTMDQVIAASGVSKPTVYTYFPSKENLCVEYLKEMHKRQIGSLEEALSRAETPRQRYMAIVLWIRESLIATDFRGCGFFNMISEIPDPGNPIIQVAKGFIDAFRKRIKQIVEELQNSDEKYQHLNPQRIADTYYLIINGAIMGCQEYRETWPSDRAVEEIQRLIE